MPAMDPAILRILRCPLCKQDLCTRNAELRCEHCARTYPIVLGIPDLRVYEDPLIPLEDDYRKGHKIQLQANQLSFAELVRFYWSLPTYPATPADLRERFIRHVLTDEDRIEGYKEKIGTGDAFVEVGCGTAALTKVAQSRFELSVGCDVAFRWLLIARKRLEEAKLPARLVCCCADFLPFADGAFSSLASISVLEHLPDAKPAVREFGRVLKPQGRIFVCTTNRFSLAPEPHVRVWGLGFLPRRWMPAYVRWKRGMAYEKKHLLSWFEIWRCFRKERLEGIEFSLPVISAADWRSLKGLERLAARVFSRLAKIPLIRWALVPVCPVLQVLAHRKDEPELNEGAVSTRAMSISR